MHEILIGIPYALLLMVIFFVFVFVVINYLTLERFYLIFGIAIFFVVAFIFGSMKSANAATPQEHIDSNTPEEMTYCQDLEKRIDTATDMEYTELQDLQERFRTECEGN